MAAFHGPPCGHTVLGTCPGCGGGRAVIGVDFGADPSHPAMTIETIKDGSLHIETPWISLTEAPAAAAPSPTLRRVGNDLYVDTAAGPINVTADPALGQGDLRINAAEQTFAREIHGRWAEPPPPVSPETIAARDEFTRRSFEAMGVRSLVKHHSPERMVPVRRADGSDQGQVDAARTAMPPIDPLNVVVQPGKATLRSLLAADEAMRREGAVAFPFSSEQRAAVSAYWSAQLRAKVAAGAAADKARETSVVVDLEEP